MWDNTKDSAMLKWALRVAPAWIIEHQQRPFGEFDACIGGWNVPGEPYTRAPGTRVRLVARPDAGRAHQSLGPHLAALRPATISAARAIDGLGDDWPIAYDDIKPWYDEVDRLVGIFGSNEGLHNHPDGIFLPPPKPRC